ncbi:MAG: hypothetical protein IPO27_01240 [Bacteroidetes bacterium]|nr:hypothetical protein [Bacteroidota bacterium]
MNKYGNILFALNKPKEALAVFKNMVTLNPKHVQGLSNLGYLTMMINSDATTSLNYINQAIALDPDYEQAHINKAAVYASQSRWYEATEALEFFIKHHPNAKKSKTTLRKIEQAVK